jgi:hypothetical protein
MAKTKNVIQKFTAYSDQYKSPLWQKKRLEIMNRDKFTCQECGEKEKQLNVHHRFYIKGRNVWEYDNDVLQTLCEDCHEKQHKKEPKNKEFIKLLKTFSDTQIEQLFFFIFDIKYYIKKYPNIFNDLAIMTISETYMNKVFSEISFLSQLNDEINPISE